MASRQVSVQLQLDTDRLRAQVRELIDSELCPSPRQRLMHALTLAAWYVAGVLSITVLALAAGWW